MISKEAILLGTNNGLDVFRHFIPGAWKPGKNFLNPFYTDKNASCYIYRDKITGIYRIKDFGEQRYTGDCFALVGLLRGLDCRDDFQEILRVIDQELSLGLDSPAGKAARSPGRIPCGILDRKPGIPETPERPPEKEGRQQVLRPPLYKEFSSRELAFWKSYGITRDVLEKFNVRAIDSFTAWNREGLKYGFDSLPGRPIFGYCEAQFVKIYRPNAKMRFLYLGQKTPGYVFGLKQLPARGHVLFITGGEKDVMALHAKGFHAICFNSESAVVPKVAIEELARRFRHIIMLYDMDPAGLKASGRHAAELREFGVKRLLLPLPGTRQSKDIADFFQQGSGAADLKKLAPGIWPARQNRLSR